MQLQLEQGTLLLDTSDGPQLITSTSLISPTSPAAQTMQERKLKLQSQSGILRWLLRQECPRLLEWGGRSVPWLLGSGVERGGRSCTPASRRRILGAGTLNAPSCV